MIDVSLVILLVGCALTTAMTARLIRSAVMLAVTSAVLTVIMFRLDSPLAAVFELSVCAGLIPAIFISAIGLTRRLDPEGLMARRKDHLKRFWYLPLIIIIVAAAMSQVPTTADFVVSAPEGVPEVRDVLWHQKHLDLIGQVVVLIGGAFAVVVLLKERKDE